MVALNTLTRKFQKREDLHWLKQDAVIRGEAQRAIAAKQIKKELAAAVGTDDAGLVDRLFEAGFTAETLPALTKAPIALIAWGSGCVMAEERATAMKAVYDSELAGHPAAIAKFQSWLDSRPDEGLFLLWADFTKSQPSDPIADSPQAKREEILRVANDVAIASGGLLGYGAICPGEQAILDRLGDVYNSATW